MLMCPIVSACDTATYNTAKFITKHLQNYCGKTSSFVKDSTDFIQKIKNLSISPEEETLVSFDVSTLCASIPLPVALQAINSKISTCTNFYKIPTEKFIRLLKFTISNASSASTRNSINNYRCSHVLTCLPCHFKYLHGTLCILSHSYISNINQVVVPVCWWCPQCNQERSSQQTSGAPQFHRPTH